ncbi:hypothetical protein [Mycolicibacterium sp. A43C]
MTTDLSKQQVPGEDTARVDYSSELVPKHGMTVVVHELSQLSHDGMGGYAMLDKLLKAGANVYLAEYNMHVGADEPMGFVKLAGPCMSMMILRDAEDRKNRTR